MVLPEQTIEFRYDTQLLIEGEDLDEDETEEYSIVGSTESNSLAGKISNESPVGKALMGAAVGDTVTVSTPAGEFKYEVLEIRKTSQG